jgi:hypothetical protein
MARQYPKEFYDDVVAATVGDGAYYRRVLAWSASI